MALSPSKEMVLYRLNEQAQKAHEAAVEDALRKGKAPPPAPKPLTEADVDFPKWLHMGFEPTGHAKGHHAPKHSVLVKDAAEEKEYRAKGYHDSPEAEMKAKLEAKPEGDKPAKK